MSPLDDAIAARPFTLARMIRAGMRHSWRVSASVALGVGTATAVIVGALLVGDSMRGSLRALTVERLGNTEAAVLPGGFFEADGITTDGVEAIPLILFDNGIAEFRDEQGAIRRAGVNSDHRMRRKFLGSRCQRESAAAIAWRGHRRAQRIHRDRVGRGGWRSGDDATAGRAGGARRQPAWDGGTFKAKDCRE